MDGNGTVQSTTKTKNITSTICAHPPFFSFNPTKPHSFLKGTIMTKILILPSILFLILLKFVHSFRSPEFSLPPELLFERSCKKLFTTATTNSSKDIWLGGCECTIPRRPGRGAKCCCSGEGVKQIGSSIGAKITAGHSISTIFLFNVSLIELGPKSLQIVPNLEELFLDSCLQLKRVHSRAFAGLQTLRKIRISNCPNLVHWEGTMLRENPRLQTLIVRNNDLRELPKMEMESAQNVLPIERIDFSGNCLRQIGKGAIRNVAVKNVDFNGNGRCLRTIGPQAFAGSKFIFLKLSGNPRLDQIHPNAFDGILHIEHLDISGSSISLLPHVGLRPLKRLNLQFVPRLKQLPPVLAFPNLVQAEFTYSHHCCFFKYASRDFYSRKRQKDGSGNEEKNLEENYREIQRRMCKEDGKEEEAIRRRRHVFVQDGGDELFKELAEWYKKVELKQTKIELNGTIKKGELKAFNDDELGKAFRLVRKCDQNAIVDQFYLNISCTPQPDALNPCEDIVNNLPRLVIWPMWIGAIFGNLAVWAVICAAWQRKMRLHYLFMLNLSLADFLTGVYLAILAFADLRTANEYYNYAVEWQTGNGCALAGFLSVFASELSIFSMLMIAIEIFYNSRFAFYGRHLSPLCAGISLLLGYIYSIGMAVLPLFGISSYQHSSICLPLHIQNPIDKFYLLFGLSFSGFAFASMIFIYILLNCTLRRSKAISTTRQEEDRQILRRTLVLIGTDMLCWVPTLFFGLTAALGLPLITLSSAKWCLVLFYPINSCANPLLYVFLTRTWRDAKKKAGPIIRRSLATTKTPRGGTLLSWNKLEKFYSSNGPKNGQKMKGDENEGLQQRPNTIHNFDGNGKGEKRKLLTEIFGEKRMAQHKRRASEGESTMDEKKKAKRDTLEPTEEEEKCTKNNNEGQPNSSTNIFTPRRKSLLPRSKISAPPQMSDISESSTSLGSSSKSKPNNTKMERKEAQKKEQIEEKKPKQQQKGKGKRGSNSSSNGGDGDSGRGDSLHSFWNKSARPSVITLFWDGIGRSPLLMAKCTENDVEEAGNSGEIERGREEWSN